MKPELEAHAAKMRERNRAAKLKRFYKKRFPELHQRALEGEKRLYIAGQYQRRKQRKSFGENAFAIEMLSVRQQAEAWKHRVAPVRIR